MAGRRESLLPELPLIHPGDQAGGEQARLKARTQRRGGLRGQYAPRQGVHHQGEPRIMPDSVKLLDGVSSLGRRHCPSHAADHIGGCARGWAAARLGDAVPARMDVALPVGNADAADLTVPSEQPSSSAVSAWLNCSQYRSTSTARCRGGSRRRSLASASRRSTVVMGSGAAPPFGWKRSRGSLACQAPRRRQPSAARLYKMRRKYASGSDSTRRRLRSSRSSAACSRSSASWRLLVSAIAARMMVTPLRQQEFKTVAWGCLEFALTGARFTPPSPLTASQGR